MATTTGNKNGTLNFDTTFEQVKDYNEQFLAAARKAGNLFVDSYEKAIDRTIELELKIAETTQQEWVTNLFEAQTGVTRGLTESYASAARSLLKQFRHGFPDRALVPHSPRCPPPFQAARVRTVEVRSRPFSAE